MAKLPFKTKVNIGKKTVIKIYKQIDNYYLNRVLEAATFLSNTGLGPKILNINIDEKSMVLEYEKVDIPEWTDELRKKMVKRIDRLHAHDFCHGDLIKENIGIKNGKLLFLDPDTMFHISIGRKDQHVLEYIRDNFDEDMSYEDFVEYDYENSWTDE
jgi:tRNA A-37 threonylcarbamoyl transferase component Bud32